MDDRAKRLGGLCEEILHVGSLGHVTLDGDGLASILPDHFDRSGGIFRVVKIVQAHFCAFERKFDRNRATDVAGAAGHNGNLSF